MVERCASLAVTERLERRLTGIGRNGATIRAMGTRSGAPASSHRLTAEKKSAPLRTLRTQRRERTIRGDIRETILVTRTRLGAPASSPASGANAKVGSRWETGTGTGTGTEAGAVTETEAGSKTETGTESESEPGRKDQRRGRGGTKKGNPAGSGTTGLNFLRPS